MKTRLKRHSRERFRTRPPSSKTSRISPGSPANGLPLSRQKASPNPRPHFAKRTSLVGQQTGGGLGKPTPAISCDLSHSSALYFRGCLSPFPVAHPPSLGAVSFPTINAHGSPCSRAFYKFPTFLLGARSAFSRCQNCPFGEAQFSRVPWPMSCRPFNSRTSPRGLRPSPLQCSFHPRLSRVSTFYRFSPALPEIVRVWGPVRSPVASVAAAPKARWRPRFSRVKC